MKSTVKTAISPEKSSVLLDRRVCVAPMLDWTDRHCRYFLRGFSSHALLYTEMITAAAILRGDRARLLAFDPDEHPVALQLGGSDPSELAAAARAGEEAGYDEINLNCGCPSDRVSSGSFGACLMLRPAQVAECVAAMRAQVRVPVTVKMRVGVVNSGARAGERVRVDGEGLRVGAGASAGSGSGSPLSPAEARAAVARFDEADFEALHAFLSAIQSAGCEVAIVHARKAVLGGLSPKDNREIPPLCYDVVRRLKQAFPDLPLIVNGGFRNTPTVLDALTWCDGVMLGREAYHRPFVLSDLEHALRERESVSSAGAHDPATPAGAPSHEPTPAGVRESATATAAGQPATSAGARERATYAEPPLSGQTTNTAAHLSPPPDGSKPPFRPPTREQLLDRMAHYAERELARGGRLSAITRHMLGLYGGEPGARDYRRMLSEGARAPGAGPDLLVRAGRLASQRATEVMRHAYDESARV
jgi:tRNA-dihydrouridine synthase A